MTKILYFSSPTCTKCQMVAKQLEKVATEDPTITTEKIDISTDDGLFRAEQYGVQALPTLIALSETNSELGRSAGQVIMAHQIKNLISPQ